MPSIKRSWWGTAWHSISPPISFGSGTIKLAPVSGMGKERRRWIVLTCKVHVGWVDEYLLFSFFL